MVVKLAETADREAVIDLLAAQLREHEIELSPARLAAAVDGVLDAPERGTLLLATADGRPVGVAYLSYTWALEHGGKVGWLEELYVTPEYRGRTIGSALLTAVLDRARRQDCAGIDLEVDAAHERAIRLYERRGFRRLSRSRFALRIR